MKPIRILIILTYSMLVSISAYTQNVLPDFSVKELSKEKIQISWNNPYPNCIQLAIQRSSDSSINFRTIFSSQSPELITNGYVDNKPFANAKSYYRIFFVLKGGDYFFSKTKAIETKFFEPIIKETVILPLTKSTNPNRKDLTVIILNKSILFQFTASEYKHFKDSINTKTNDGLHRVNDWTVEWQPSIKKRKIEFYFIYKEESLIAELNKYGFQKFTDSIRLKTRDTLFKLNKERFLLKTFIPLPFTYFLIYKNDSLVLELEKSNYKSFKDSLLTKTKDTIFMLTNNRVDIHPFQPKYIWQSSKYIFVNTKGYVTIQIPMAKKHHYRIIFYEESGSELFQIKNITETELLLDKTAFIHSGWFYFELFEDNNLKEKNKFFLGKE